MERRNLKIYRPEFNAKGGDGVAGVFENGRPLTEEVGEELARSL